MTSLMTLVNGERKCHFPYGLTKGESGSSSSDMCNLINTSIILDIVYTILSVITVNYSLNYISWELEQHVSKITYH